MSLLYRTPLFDLLFLALALLHLVVAPYTKVEESFSVQATHDILFHGDNLPAYDHLEFSGVVPRSFVGPLSVSAMAYPLMLLLAGGEDAARQGDRRWVQTLVRAMLGVLYAWSFSFFRRSVARLYGDERLANLISLLCCAQFHTLFYCTRLLPNVFAAVAVNVALGYYAQALAQPRPTITASFMVAAFAFACIVLRCDMLLLATPCILSLLLSNKLTPSALLVRGLTSSALWLLLTVRVDSFFWRRWVWPELSVLLFNNPVEGKYDQWGASPFHWYFSSALPRGLMAATLLLPLGCLRQPPSSLQSLKVAWKQPALLLQVDPIALQLLLPALAFVCLYSLLSHKELRFILPAFPLFTAVAAIGVLKTLPPQLPAVNPNPTSSSTSTSPTPQATRPLAFAPLTSSAKEVFLIIGLASAASFIAPLLFERVSGTFYLSAIAIPAIVLREASGWLLGLASPDEPQPRAHAKKGSGSLLSRPLLLLLTALLLASFLFSLVFLYISSLNYPGGEAFALFHSHIPTPTSPTPSPPTVVHLSNLACISGVTRYGERLDGGVQYSKEEGLDVKELGQRGFEWLMEEVAEVEGYEVVARVEGFGGVEWRKARVVMKPQLYLLRATANRTLSTPDDDSYADR